MNLIRGTKHTWEVCIGLEIHAQILLGSKLFSSAGTGTLGGSGEVQRPNSAVAFFDAAFPGKKMNVTLVGIAIVM